MGNTAYVRLESAKASSRAHNSREIIADYVHQDKMENNKHYYFNSELKIISPELAKSHSEIRKNLGEFYTKNTGQKVQEKQQLLMEGLMLFSDKNSDEEILDSVKSFCIEYRMPLIELHIHRDEGHYDEEEQWKPNLHAHFVYANLEMEDRIVHKKNKKGENIVTNLKGKSLKFTNKDTSNMQIFFAEKLGLQKGNSKGREHLSHIQYKNKIQQEKSVEIQNEIELSAAFIKDLKYQKEKAKQELTETREKTKEAIENANKILKGEKKLSSLGLITNPLQVKELQSSLIVAQEHLKKASIKVKNLEERNTELFSKIETSDDVISDLKNKVKETNDSLSKSQNIINNKNLRIEYLERFERLWNNFDNELESKLLNGDYRRKVGEMINDIQKEVDLMEHISKKVAEIVIKENLSLYYDDEKILNHIDDFLKNSTFIIQGKGRSEKEIIFDWMREELEERNYDMGKGKGFKR